MNVLAQDNANTPSVNGLIPSVLNLRYDYNQQTSRILYRASNLPTTYDLRLLNRVTSVKDQDSDNTCWAFASTASAESSLLRGGMTDTNVVTASPRPTLNPGIFDFSENHMKQSVLPSVGDWGFSWQINEGGNREMATAYLARAQGEVLEKNDPYEYGNNLRDNSINKSIPADKYLEKALFFPEPSSSYYMRNVTYRDKIKQAVIDYGAIYTGIRNDSASYNYTTHSYYYSGIEDYGNHAVCIVGWDDSYPASNFSTNPAVDGAFIVKNSWGSDFGDNGYFYVSYEDKIFGQQSTAFVMSPVKRSYKNVYQYDPLGWVNYFGFGNTTWFANVFTKKSSSESLTTVGFYATAVNTSYEIHYAGIAEGEDINSAVLTKLTSGTVPYPGYYAIDIPSPPSINTDKFVVAIKANTPNYNYPVAYEYVYPGYSDNAIAEAGQSYVSPYGTLNSWRDFTTYEDNGNVCLKAFTTDNAEYRTVFKQQSLTTGQVDFRVYCDNKLATDQSPKIVVASLLDNELIYSNVFNHTFPSNEKSYIDFSFFNTFNQGTDLWKITTKIFVISSFESTFAPLMRYSEEMNK